MARRAVDDLAAARLLRAAGAERQLEEVLVDFWFNHFNVNAAKGRTAIYLASYEGDAIRPHVLGRFRDLLGATARHPAMLIYLDNARSRGGRLNENYARELLELHTVGVDGGYSQEDVIAVARAFTGWTVDRPGRGSGRGGGFRFVPALHDAGPKVVLGQTIAGGGVNEGERVLDLLAAHPATSRHLAAKLARKFVSDDPPQALVERAAARFRATGGDLREMLRTIVTSPEFFAPEARGAKVKTPLEFVVSILRLKAEATGDAAEAVRRKADIAERRAAVNSLRTLGMPLYLCQPPTGYDDSADTWVTAGALVARMNVAQRIAGPHAAVAAAPEFQKR
jgi:uncharacterized protein (DUF1800 family)